MKSILRISLVYLIGLMMLAGCGGGGSSSSPAPAVSKSTVKLKTEGTLPQGTELSGIAVTITLPAGVTVDTVGTDVAAGVVTVSGVASQGGASVKGAEVYTPAGAAPGKLEFTIAASNFGTGEFATVKFNVAPGSTAPTTTDVTILPADQTLHPVNNLSVVVTPS